VQLRSGLGMRGIGTKLSSPSRKESTFYPFENGVRGIHPRDVSTAAEHL
jgi:hypothetical protein